MVLLIGLLPKVFESALTCIKNVEVWINLIRIDYESLEGFENPNLPSNLGV